jgi:hypothetical protein
LRNIEIEYINSFLYCLAGSLFLRKQAHMYYFGFKEMGGFKEHTTYAKSNEVHA